MSHRVVALVGRPSALQRVQERIPGARVVPLPQGFALLPLTDELLEGVQRLTEAESGEELEGFIAPDGFARLLRDISIAEPVVLIETDYFGGIGSQGAALFNKGMTTFMKHESNAGGRPTVEVSPISQALGLLGVVKGDEFDEFAAMGLQRHRSNSGWLAQAS